MNRDLLISCWKRGRVSLLISACFFLYLLKFTWLKWGDLIIDTGREAYVPLALISGKILYRDIFYLYGPFPPYFNAFLFKIFGAHLNTLIVSGALTICASSVLIYKISRAFLNIFIATFTAITFLFVFAFGNYYYAGIFNFILPYSYPATYGILFSLASLYFFYLWLKKRPGASMYWGTLFLTLSLLCRIEIGLAVLIGISMGLCAYLFKNKAYFNMRRSIECLLAFVACPILMAFSVYYLFFIISKDMLGRSNLLDIFFSNISFNSLFAKNLFASNGIFTSILVIGKVFLYYIVLCALFILGGILLNYTLSFKKSFIKKTVSFFMLAMLFSIAYVFVKKYFSVYLQYRILPFICLFMAIWFLWKFMKNKKYTDIFISTLAIFSFLLALRMLLNAWAGHYGFYILVPALIVYYTLFFKVTPDLFKSEIIRISFMVCFFLLASLFIMDNFSVSSYFYKNRTLKITSGRGYIYVFGRDRDYKCKQLLEFLKENTDEKDTLVVFPEGVFINFLSKRDNPLYYYQYLPIDLVRESVERDIINDIENKKIDYIAIIQRDVTEYGHIAFGHDYGRKVYDYIMNNYTLSKQFGPLPFTEKVYGIALFKRNA